MKLPTLLLTATAASALDYLSSLKTPTAPSVRAPPATPASVPATREELLAQWRAACDVEVTSYADFGLRVAPAKAPLEAVVAAPAKAVAAPALRQEARRPHLLDDTIREALDEMTEAVDLLVSPQLARHEIRALCRSMTEEVDAAAAPQLGRSLKRVARADFENWLADRKTRWRAERGYEYKTNAPRPGRELNEAELAALKDEWAREQAAADP